MATSNNMHVASDASVAAVGASMSTAPAGAAARPAMTPRNGVSSEPMFRAATVRSGELVVLGMRVDASINCAGMVRFRVFQGHVEVLGFQPALGTYYPLYSPRWSSLLVLAGRTNASTRAVATKTQLEAAYQAPFSDATRQLLALEDAPASAHIDLDDEHAADALARELAEDFAIVLVLRAVPVTHGNVVCYFESTSRIAAAEPLADVVLPGFKILVARDAHSALHASTTSSTTTPAPTPAVALRERQYHDWKAPARILAELAPAETSFRTLEITRAWQSTADALESSLLASTTLQQRIVVCGAKGVGKSTFCRYVINRLLAHYSVVAFLDTDLGQSELTPPGLVSLHALTSPLLGPGFTHMAEPLRSFFCGGTNPGTDPLVYLEAVQALLAVAGRKWNRQSSTAAVPLVINTDGWIKSMGHDLLCAVIEAAAPQHVVQLLATTKNKQFTVPTTGDWRVHRVGAWDPTGVVAAPRSSKDMRLYRWHQYFVGQSRALDLSREQLQIVHASHSDKQRVEDAIARAYTRVRPFVVSFDHVDVAFAGGSVAPSHVLVALNNSIVGLCVNRRRRPLSSPLDDATPPRILLAPALVPCLGVGLVRAIDPIRRLLYVVSPLPHALLQRVNLLVRGNFPMTSLVVDVDAPVQAPYAVTDVLPSEGTGAAAMQSRNNLKRKRDDKSSSK